MVVKSVEKREDGTVKFQVEIDPEAFEAALNRAYIKNKNKITVSGFRRGKAPRKLIEAMYGRDFFQEDAVERVSQEAFDFGAAEEKLDAVGKSALSDVEVGDDKSCTLTFETAVYPEVTLGEYKNLEAVKPDASVSDAEVDSEVEKIRRRNAREEVVEREAAEGDTLLIDFEGFLDGVPFEGGKAENHSLKLGSEQFIPGFEEQLVGVKAGEECDVAVTFPEDYAEELAGKEAVFHVKVKEVKEEQLPELDDEFAKDVSEFDTLDEYRESVRRELEHKKEHEAGHAFEDNLLQKAADNMTAVIPEVMISSRQDGLLREFAQNLAAQGMSLEQYLGMFGMEPKAFRDSTRATAEKQVRIRALLKKVAEAEGIEATDEEIEAEYAKFAEEFGEPVETLKAELDGDMIKEDIRRRKASDLIVDSGIPVAAEPEAEEAPAEEVVLMGEAE
ncbi:MAG: trigger factor [Firmicutes bacterium]|nr:trigger factor [Bacillota bacterium]